MGKLVINVDDETEEQFIRAVEKKFGIKYGNKGFALKEAITDWIKKNG